MIGNYEITTGVLPKALRVVIYGPEGIGKSTLAASFPNPVVIDIEGSTNQLDIPRMPTPKSWSMLMQEIQAVAKDSTKLSTLIIDTIDAAEALCAQHVIASGGQNVKSIEDFGYGKGYAILAEQFGKFLNALADVQEKGVNVVLVAHSQMRKFERPDEMGAYDRFELKLTKKVAPMPKEWADMVLFCDYKTYVTTTKTGTHKATGGNRVIRTTHKPQWDAKNRFGLEEELPLEYASIASVIPDFHPKTNTSNTSQKTQDAPEAPKVTSATPKMQEVQTTAQSTPKNYPPELQGLIQLMEQDNITEDELRKVVAKKGYYPYECTIENYPQDFVQWMVGLWEQVKQMVEDMRLDEEVPF